MGRRVACAMCDALFDLEEANTLKISFSSLPDAGIQRPTLNIDADVCSSACLRNWLETRAYDELRGALSRWTSIGAYRLGANASEVVRPPALPREVPDRHVPKGEPFNPLTFPMGIVRKRSDR